VGVCPLVAGEEEGEDVTCAAGEEEGGGGEVASDSEEGRSVDVVRLGGRGIWSGAAGVVVATGAASSDGSAA
jgi:hypothetical protein